MREPVARSFGVKGVKIGYWEWRADPGNQEPPLIFVHATGFHARLYDKVIEHFEGRRILSIDMRGHGRSEGGPIDSWQTAINDVAVFLDQLRIRRAIGVGHSMGGHVLAQCAGDMAGIFSQLILFDPVIFSPEFYSNDPMFSSDTPHPASRRKRDFASPEAMMERFRERDPYDLFDARVFEDYCRFGLRKKANEEGYELACLPEVEASYYSASQSNPGIHEALKRIDIPTLVVRAKQTEIRDFKGSPTWPMLADYIPTGQDMPRPDRTHFHPFEDPADAAAIIEQAIAG